MRRLARAFWEGMCSYGLVMGGVVVSTTGSGENPTPPEPDRRCLDVPPPGHPERCHGAPPTETERLLWAQLTDLRTPPSGSAP